MKTRITLYLFIAVIITLPARLIAQTTTETNKTKDTITTPFALRFIGFGSPKGHYLATGFNLNILSGYSNEVRVGEIAGLVNRVKGDVRCFQIAGLVNSVSDSVRGTQIAGIFNHSAVLNGIQIGGLANVVRKNSNGTQLAGIANYSNSLKGLQIGGIVNTTAKKVDGSQLAGIINRADTLNGFQLGGLVNSATVTNGFQLSGLINQTKLLNGFQLSFLNFADTSRGIPFGFLSYVKKGYHKIEFTLDELLLPTIGFRMGVEKFHNIFFTGIDLSETPLLWTYGYGLGTSIPINGKLNFICDITSQQLQTTNNNKHIRLNLLNKLYPAVEYKAFKKLNIAVGPTYNVFLSDVTGNNYGSVYSKLAPYHFYNYTSDDINVKMWVGIKLSVKFL